jgi:hypothetical protein
MQHAFADAHERSYANNVSRTPGREAETAQGERLYINFYPHFVLRYWPFLNPEQLLYRVWEEEILAHGWGLFQLYEQLKAHSPEHLLKESAGPYDPASGKPCICKIEFQTRL